VEEDEQWLALVRGVELRGVHGGVMPGPDVPRRAGNDDVPDLDECGNDGRNPLLIGR
jgi:hypothetical protein